MISNSIITGGQFSQIVDGAKGGFERLEAATSPAAFHNSRERFDPPKCHTNTRVAVIKRIMNWILRLNDEEYSNLMMWLYGPAGSGKSAIAQSIAEKCYALKKLLGSFFFSRSDLYRSSTRSLIATLAYQVASNLPQSREFIVAAIDRNPLIFELSVKDQLAGLIIEPLQRLGATFFDNPDVPYLFIIDGLDECQDRAAQRNLLDVLSNMLRHSGLPLQLLISSRPEPEISTFFLSPMMIKSLSRLALDDLYYPSHDIRIFLRDKFQEVKDTHPLRHYIPSSWPGEENIDKIAEKSSGQFIFASTMVKYISFLRDRPDDRLEIVLGQRPPYLDGPFAELDALYRLILSSVDDIQMVLKVLGLAILAKHMGHNEKGHIEKFLHLRPGAINLILGDLSSIISLDGKGFAFIRGIYILHASFEDFLLDESRSKDMFLNPSLRHAEYAHQYFVTYEGDVFCEGTFDPFLYHFSRSCFTEELRQDILNFSYNEIGGPSLPFHKCDFRLTEMFVLAPKLVRSLKALQWGEKQAEVHTNHLNGLDQYLLARVEPYYKSPQLTLLLAATTCQAARLSNERFRCGRYWLFEVSKLSLSFDGQLLDLVSALHFSTDFDFGFCDMISEFLADSRRSGQYALNGKRYAVAALQCMKYLNIHQIHPSPVSSRSSYEAGTHVGILPSTWRKVRKVMKHGDKYQRGRRQMVQVWSSYLPELLKEAGKHEDLIHFIRQESFPLSMEDDFPHEAFLVRNVVAGYLARTSDEV